MSPWIPKNRILRALIIGALLSLAWSPLNLFPMMWLGWWLLLQEVRESDSIRQAMARVYLPIVLWNLGSTYWLMMATVAGGIAAIMANSVVLAIPLGLAWPFLKKEIPKWMGIFSAAAIWILFEWLHTRWELAWPWLQLGNGLAAWPSLYQWISLTGIFGLSFWIFISTALIPNWDDWGKAGTWKPFLWITTVPVIISIIMYMGLNHDIDRRVPVTVVQPNYDSYLPMAGFREPVSPLVQLIALTDSVRTDSSALVIWPENSVMDDIYSNFPRESQFLLEAAARERNATFLIGATYMDIFPVDTQEPLVRRFRNGVPFKAYNSALAWPAGDTLRVYKKRHLVPIVETIPWLRWLDAVDVAGIDFPQLNSYHRGTEVVNFNTAYGPVPAMVCYDSVFPNWVRRTVLGGASFVTVITNDGWWGNTSGHYQHFEFSRLRAVETRRAVLRSANNGFSGVIDAKGNVIRKTKYWERTGFTEQIPVYTALTLYSRLGDWFVFVCLIVLISGLRTLRQSRRKESQ
jgi:apolipoprotein N-acyltransferase